MKIIQRFIIFLLILFSLIILISFTIDSLFVPIVIQPDEIVDKDCRNLPPPHYVHPVYLANGPPIQSEPLPKFESKPAVNSASLTCNLHNKTLIIIHSHVNHDTLRTHKRAIFRKEWLTEHNAVMYFVVGSDPDIDISDEMRLYGDIIQVDTIENYHNITYKAIFWIKEIAKCEIGPKLLLKIDDDVYIDTIGLNFLVKRYHSLDDFIACRVLPSVQVVRNVDSKWYLSKKEYKFNNLGTYCQGLAYFISGNLLPIMNSNIDKSQVLWMDDWYVTRSLIGDHKISYYSLDQHVFAPNSVVESQQLLGQIKLRKWRTIFAHFRPPQKFPVYRRKQIWANITAVNDSCFILSHARRIYVPAY